MRKRFTVLLIGLILFAPITSIVQAVDGTTDPPAWAEPKNEALKLISSGYNLPSQTSAQHNLDCDVLTYRSPSSSVMQEGCFTETAFGLFDSNSQTAIFNGTDEGVPLLTYSPHESLVAWPQAGTLISLDTTALDGSYISLYKGILEHLQDQRNTLGQLTAKQLTAGADLHLKGPDGKLLVINPQTLAFSDGGSWLVAEDLNGSFVRINLATLEYVPFAPFYGSTGSPALLQSQLAISQDGRYVAVANKAAASLKVYDLKTCDQTEVNNLEPLSCKSYDYQPFVSEKVGVVQLIQHIRFINEGLISFQVLSNDSSKTGLYELAPASRITSSTGYLGLGDSYTSGEGTFDYLSGTDTEDNTCHLSANSYPLLITHDLFGSASGHSVACSGAVIEDLASTSDSYSGQVQNGLSYRSLRDNQPGRLTGVMANFLPGYVAQQQFVRQWQPGVATVSVGGNDIGFGDIVQQCVAPHLGLSKSANTCFSSYEDRLELKNLVDRTEKRWVALYRKLASAAPSTRIYAIGYPQIAVAGGNCALNVHLNNDEIDFTSELVGYLDSVIKQAATEANVTYVDISQALAGHRLCETASYNVGVNGLTAGNDFVGILGRESYHPNALGHQLIELAIIRQTNNLGSLQKQAEDPATASKLLDKPGNGRKIYSRLPGAKLEPKLVKQTKQAAVRVTSSQRALKPNKTYAVRLDGPNGGSIGSAVSDTEGNIDANIPLPENISAGGHTVDITGEGESDEDVDITVPVYVGLNSDDSDGDGIVDSQDSCRFVSNSGVDADRDGIDDTCDPLVGLLSVSSDSPGGTNSMVKAGQRRSPPSPSNFNSGDPPLQAIARNQPDHQYFLTPRSKLRVISWFLWFILLATSYLLAVLVGLLLRWRRKKRYKKANVSTTIEP